VDVRVCAEEYAGVDEVEGRDGVDAMGEAEPEAVADTGADVEAAGRGAGVGVGE
jgi:hypothetical protein